MKISNVSIWATVTGIAVILGYTGWFTGWTWPIYASVAVWCLIGAVDVYRIIHGDMTISARIREATAKWCIWPIIVLTLLAAFKLGGWKLVVFALICFLTGHWWG